MARPIILVLTPEEEVALNIACEEWLAACEDGLDPDCLDPDDEAHKWAKSLLEKVEAAL